MTTLADFHRVFAAYAAELEAHEAEHAGIWEHHPVLFHVDRLAAHVARARALLASGSSDYLALREELLHAFSRETLSAELFLRGQEGPLR